MFVAATEPFMNEPNSHLTGFLRLGPSLYDVLNIKNHPYEIINDNVGQRFTEFFLKNYPLPDINYQCTSDTSLLNPTLFFGDNKSLKSHKSGKFCYPGKAAKVTLITGIVLLSPLGRGQHK